MFKKVAQILMFLRASRRISREMWKVWEEAGFTADRLKRDPVLTADEWERMIPYAPRLRALTNELINAYPVDAEMRETLKHGLNTDIIVRECPQHLQRLFMA